MVSFSKLFVSLMAMLTIGRTQRSVDLNDNFVQIQTIPKQIVQPKETVYIPLEKYFRGQLLHFEFNEDIGTSELDSETVKLQQPVQKTFNATFDYDKTAHVSFQSTLLHRDNRHDLKLVFINHQMKLVIYTLTDYQQAIEESIPQAQVYNLDNNSSQPLQSCSGLIKLQENLLMANCKLKQKSQSDIPYISLTIDISNSTNHKDTNGVKLTRISNEYTPLDINSGRLELFRKIGEGTFQFFSLHNKTNSFLDIIQLNEWSNFSYVHKICKYKDHYVQNETLESEEHDMLKDVKLLEPTMEVVDVLSHQETNTVFISDYNQGLIMMDRDLKDKDDYKVFYRSNIPKAGKLKKIMTDNENDEQTMLVTQIRPPCIYEFNITNIRQPFIRRIYRIIDDDENYVGQDIVDGNKKYIITQLLSIQDFQLVTRVYSRDNTYFSFAQKELKTKNEFNHGIFLSFLKFSENSFLLKTEQDFKILKIQPHFLVIDAFNNTSIETKGYINKTYVLDLVAHNYSDSQIHFKVEVMFQPMNTTKTCSTVPSFVKNLESVYYNCGQKTLGIDMQSWFSGPRLQMAIESEDGDQNSFFEVTNPSYKIKNDHRGDADCRLNGLASFTISGKQESYLFCASYNESTIYFPASHANNSRALNKNINKNIFSAKIISIGNDIDDNRLLIFSNRDNRGDDTLEVHMFEFSNVMSWESKININNDITEELRDFMLRLKGTLSFNVKEDLGTMISDHKSSTDEAVRNISIVAFQVPKDYKKDQFFKILAKLDLNSTSDILHAFMGPRQYLWLLLSNSTIRVYQPIQKTDRALESSPPFEMRFANYIDYNQTDKYPNQPIKNFYIGQDRLVTFIGNYTISVGTTEEGPYELKLLMELPLFFHASPNKEEDAYEFVYNQFKEEVVFTTVDDYMYVMFKVYNSTDSKTVINIYKLSGSRHDSLKMQIELEKNQFKIDYSQTSIHAKNAKRTGLGLHHKITIISEKNLTYIDVSLSTTVEMNAKGAQKLKEECKKGEVQMDYKILPLENSQESLNQTIVAQNKGLIVHNQRDQDSLTIFNDRPKNQQYNINGNYPLLQNFNGFNLEFGIRCDNLNEQTSQTCSNIILSPTNYTQSNYLEYLSNSLQTQGFFIVGSTYLVMDSSNRLTVNDAENNKYEFASITDILECQAVKYNIFKYYYSSGQVFYLFYQCDTKQIGLTKILQFPESQTKNLKREDYQIFFDKTFIKKVKGADSQSKLYSHVLVYSYSEDNLMSIIAYEMPEKTFQTIVEFYNVNLHTGPYTEFTFLRNKTLGAGALSFDNFQINAMVSVPHSSLIVFGLQNYGIVIYDVLKFEMVRAQPIFYETQYQPFQISSIVVENSQVFHLQILQFGTISLNYKEFCDGQQKQVDYSKMESDTYYGFEDQLLINTGEVAQNNMGFAYLIRDGPQYYIQFFSYFNMRNTKFIGKVPLDINGECSFLQSFPLEIAQEMMDEELDSNYFAVSLMCGTSLTLAVFNYFPRLIVNNTIQNEEHLSIVYNVTIEASNSLDDRSSMILSLVTINTNLQVNPMLYVSFSLLIALIMVLYLIITKSADQEQRKRPQSQQNLRKIRDRLSKQIQDQQQPVQEEVLKKSN